MNLWKSVGKHILSVQLKSKSDSQESKLSYEVFKNSWDVSFMSYWWENLQV